MWEWDHLTIRASLPLDGNKRHIVGKKPLIRAGEKLMIRVDIIDKT
jgi:hypothetical protein